MKKVEVKLGDKQVQRLRTYQIKEDTKLQVTCGKHSKMKAFLCSSTNCDVKAIAGDCKKGWKISFKNFEQFRQRVVLKIGEKANLPFYVIPNGIFSNFFEFHFHLQIQ